ncbi:3-methyl-2-oxobutanoate hydroxymethyltransferase [Coralliovum pocilloporae]|uniref:3-methyl-2-oxobutanoate hydroxymethyltransferase n=1 Tax=Coralliovum pocilloporae TaxID=3066369 RepID=UPI003307A05C
MRNIYTFGGFPARRNVTIADLQAGKGKRKFTETTAFTPDEALAAQEAGIDTLSCNAWDIAEVRKAADTIFMTGALPYTDYISADDILKGAIETLEAGADMVYTCRGLHIIEMLAKEDIPVMAHAGLVPRKSTWVGGLRAIGRTAEEGMALYQSVKDIENAGAAAVEIEVVPEETLAAINPLTSLITFSIGAGSGGDVMFLFQEDICGETENPARHVRTYGNLKRLKDQMQQERIAALTAFREDVERGGFPGDDVSVRLKPEEHDRLQEMLAKL